MGRMKWHATYFDLFLGLSPVHNSIPLWCIITEHKPNKNRGGLGMRLVTTYTAYWISKNCCLPPPQGLLAYAARFLSLGYAQKKRKRKQEGISLSEGYYFRSGSNNTPVHTLKQTVQELA